MSLVQRLTIALDSKQQKIQIIFLFSLLLGSILVFSCYLLSQFQSVWAIVPILGLCLLSLFAYFIWQQQQQFQQQRQQFLRQTKQHDLILQTTQNGLLLLNRQLILESEHSLYANTLLQRAQLSGQPLVAVLEPLMLPKELQVTQRFLQQLFDARISDELLKQLNPLVQIDLQLSLQDAQKSSVQCLSFHFTRIYEQQDIAYVLIHISDMTHTVQQQHLLNRAELQSQFLLSIIQTDTLSIQTLMTQINAQIQFLSDVLNTAEAQPNVFGVLMKHIMELKQLAHTHQLNLLSHLMDEFENHCHNLKQKNHLQADDFTALHVIIQQLKSAMHVIQQFCSRLEQSELNTIESERPETIESLNTHWEEDENWHQWQQDLLVLAQNQQKNIVLDTTTAFFQNLPLQLAYKLQDFAWYLIQRAAIHSIETTTERANNGKPETGHIQVVLSDTQTHYQLQVHDDGRGIDFEAITTLAVNLGWLSENASSMLNHTQLTHYLFEPEFAILSSLNQDAPQSMYLGTGRTWLDEQNGHIDIDVTPHQRTTITLTLPK